MYRYSVVRPFGAPVFLRVTLTVTGPSVVTLTVTRNGLNRTEIKCRPPDSQVEGSKLRAVCPAHPG